MLGAPEKVVFIAVDFTRSGDRSLPLKLLDEIAGRHADAEASIVIYGARAYPFLDPTPVRAVSIEELSEQMAAIPYVEGPSEPSAALKEAVNTALEYGLAEESTVIIVWGAARQPKVPLWLQAVYAENSGVDWALVVSRPSPPRWMPRVLGPHEDKLYTVRKSTSIRRLVDKIFAGRRAAPL